MAGSIEIQHAKLTHHTFPSHARAHVHACAHPVLYHPAAAWPRAESLLRELARALRAFDRVDEARVCEMRVAHAARTVRLPLRLPLRLRLPSPTPRLHQQWCCPRGFF